MLQSLLWLFFCAVFPRKNQIMRTRAPSSLSIGAFLLVSFSLIVLGVGGLYWVIVYTLPTLGPRWLFFFFLVCAGAGIALPLMALLNRRFSADSADARRVVVREATWVGIYLAMLAWLQLSRALTAGLAILLAIGMTGVEFLWRLRERSRWQPSAPERGGE